MFADIPCQIGQFQRGVHVIFRTVSLRDSKPYLLQNQVTCASSLTPCRSHVPPVRDDESETQRKAHAKLVRQTRRSTQGVTLEDLKSAEKLVKSRNQEQQQFQVSFLGCCAHTVWFIRDSRNFEFASLCTKSHIHSFRVTHGLSAQK